MEIDYQPNLFVHSPSVVASNLVVFKSGHNYLTYYVGKLAKAYVQSALEHVFKHICKSVGIESDFYRKDIRILDMTYLDVVLDNHIDKKIFESVNKMIAHFRAYQSFVKLKILLQKFCDIFEKRRRVFDNAVFV